MRTRPGPSPRTVCAQANCRVLAASRNKGSSRLALESTLQASATKPTAPPAPARPLRLSVWLHPASALPPDKPQTQLCLEARNRRLVPHDPTAARASQIKPIVVFHRIKPIATFLSGDIFCPFNFRFRLHSFVFFS